MKKRGWRKRAVRSITAIALGGSLFQFGSCDPAVRDALLSGLETTSQALAQTLIQAFFTGLEDSSDSGSGGTGLTTT